MQTLCDYRPASTNGAYPCLYVNASNQIEYYVNTGVRITGTTTLTSGTLYRARVARVSGVTRIFINGTQEGSSWTDSSNMLVGGTTRPVYHKRLYEKDVVITPNVFLSEVYREGNRLVAVLTNEYTGTEEERVVDQIVVENGVLPNDALYYALKEASRNHGQIDLATLFTAKPQPAVDGEGAFLLYRIGDCVSCRDIHAAIYDALRLCKDF